MSGSAEDQGSRAAPPADPARDALLADSSRDALLADSSRDALLARWLELTRVVLPGMARAQRWPIRLDHCFMRVCLDHALGRRWDRAVRRPALRHLDRGQLARAVAAAERVAADPAALPRLNCESLAMRGRSRG